MHTYILTYISTYVHELFFSYFKIRYFWGDSYKNGFGVDG
jgi:hypothetical protein